MTISLKTWSVELLRAKLSQMRTDGMNHIERKDFDALLQTYNLQEVLSLVQLGNREDEVKVAEQMEEITYILLSTQAAKCAK